MASRTTVRLEESLLAEAKALAARQSKTLTSLIEDGLRLAISKHQAHARRRNLDLPVSRRGGGTMPGVDLANSAEVLDLLETRR
jgi:hypothetical protein